MRELEEARKLALNRRQTSAAVAATMGKAQLFVIVIPYFGNKEDATGGTSEVNHVPLNSLLAFSR